MLKTVGKRSDWLKVKWECTCCAGQWTDTQGKAFKGKEFVKGGKVTLGIKHHGVVELISENKDELIKEIVANYNAVGEEPSADETESAEPEAVDTAETESAKPQAVDTTSEDDRSLSDQSSDNSSDEDYVEIPRPKPRKRKAKSTTKPLPKKKAAVTKTATVNKKKENKAKERETARNNSLEALRKFKAARGLQQTASNMDMVSALGGAAVQEPIRVPAVQEPVRVPAVQEPVRVSAVQEPVRVQAVQEPMHVPAIEGVLQCLAVLQAEHKALADVQKGQMDLLAEMTRAMQQGSFSTAQPQQHSYTATAPSPPPVQLPTAPLHHPSQPSYVDMIMQDEVFASNSNGSSFQIPGDIPSVSNRQSTSSESSSYQSFSSQSTSHPTSFQSTSSHQPHNLPTSSCTSFQPTSLSPPSDIPNQHPSIRPQTEQEIRMASFSDVPTVLHVKAMGMDKKKSVRFLMTNMFSKRELSHTNPSGTTSASGKEIVCSLFAIGPRYRCIIDWSLHYKGMSRVEVNDIASKKCAEATRKRTKTC